MKEEKSHKVDFRCPADRYRACQIILGQKLDPRALTISDMCNIGLELYLDTVEAYASRPDVKQARQIRKALDEAEFKAAMVEAKHRLSTLTRQVGNGQFKYEMEGADVDVKAFLHEERDD